MIKEFKDLLSNKDDLDILFKQPIKELNILVLKYLIKICFMKLMCCTYLTANIIN